MKKLPHIEYRLYCPNPKFSEQMLAICIEEIDAQLATFLDYHV